MHPFPNLTQLDQWIARLQQINTQGALPRQRHNNQRTTTDIHEDAQQILKQLQQPFHIDFEWQAVNCVLIECLRSLECKTIQPDRVIIPHLQALNHRLLPLRADGGERKTIALHREAKQLLTLLRPQFRAPKFRCRYHWQTFNCVLIHCLGGNPRLMRACRDLVMVDRAA